MPTVQIFVSHSRDDPNLHFFQQAFAASLVKGVFMELESIKPPPWHTIKQQVAISRCLFVSLSRPLLNWDYRHTGNWIDFEVGLACMQNKHVWVFEPLNEAIDFAVPYCTHYVLYNSASEEEIVWLKQQIGNYLALLGPFFNDKLIVHCPKERCGLAFYMLADLDEFPCPSCRTRLKRDLTKDSPM